jgi:serine/threonine protein phosphatase PrpC
VGAGGGAGDGRHFSTTNAQAAMATSTSAFCPSPSAWVSIPEMEMLRQYFASIMEDALLSLDDYLRNTPEGMRGDYDCVGCTACVVGITANFVLCANVGDSGAAFYTKDRIKVISVKHRVSDEAEQKRINAAGYSIVNDRIEGMSAVPRALGDFDFKQCGGRGPHEQAVSAVPDVTIMPTPSDTNQWGIILACDGVWDTATLHQVHVALTNTVNDLDVAGSATDAVLRGAELFQHHLRGPRAPCGESPASLPQCSSPAVEGGASIRASKGATREDTKKPNREREGSISPSPAKRRSLLEEEGGEGSVIGDYDCDEGLEVRRLPQVDPILLTAAAGVFAQCVAPADNDEGVGLDNCSLILIERRNVQE